MTGNRYGRSSEDVRRAYLRHGGNARAAAKELGMSRPAVFWHVKRANELHPLAVPADRLTFAPGTSPEDMEALAAYSRASLDRVGVLRAPPPDKPE